MQIGPKYLRIMELQIELSIFNRQNGQFHNPHHEKCQNSLGNAEDFLSAKF